MTPHDASPELQLFAISQQTRLVDNHSVNRIEELKALMKQGCELLSIILKELKESGKAK